MFNFNTKRYDTIVVGGEGQKLKRALIKSESGFSIISVVVAFAFLAAVIVPATKLMISLTSASGNVRDRIVASNLANQEVELLTADAQSEFNTLVSGSLGTKRTSATVGGLVYSISTTLAWGPGASGGSCGSSSSGSSQLEPLLQASIEVSWNSMTPIVPVRETTTLVPPTSSYSNLSGNLSVQVLDSAGSGVANVPVSVAGPAGGAVAATTEFSSASGCAFFPFLAAGNYSVSLRTPDGTTWVDQLGNTSPTQSAGVSIGSTTMATFTYDRAATISVVARPPSFPILPGAQYSLYNSSLGGNEVLNEPANSTTIGNLFPFGNGYQFYLGDCYNALSPPPAAIPAVTTNPGLTTSASSAATELTLSIDHKGSPLAGASISLAETDSKGNPMISCTTSSYPNAATTDTSGSASLTVPIGYFSVSISSSAIPSTYTDPTPIDTTAGGVESVSINVP